MDQWSCRHEGVGIENRNHKIGRRRIERFKRGLKGLENARGNSTTGGDEITTCKDWRNTAPEIPAIKGHLFCFSFFCKEFTGERRWVYTQICQARVLEMELGNSGARYFNDILFKISPILSLLLSRLFDDGLAT